MRLLLDTTVLVDLLRGNSAAVKFTGSLTQKPSVSAVTIAELYAGVRMGAEIRHIERLRFGLDLVPVDDQIAEMAGGYSRRFGRSHGVKIPDALIAATAEHVGARLVTHNVKHFPMFADVLVPY